MVLTPFLKFLESNDPDFGQAIEKVVSLHQETILMAS